MGLPDDQGGVQGGPPNCSLGWSVLLPLPTRPCILEHGSRPGKGAQMPGVEPGFGKQHPQSKQVYHYSQLLNILVLENKIIFFTKVFYVCWCIMYLLLIEVNNTFCNFLS